MDRPSPRLPRGELSWSGLPFLRGMWCRRGGRCRPYRPAPDEQLLQCATSDVGTADHSSRSLCGHGIRLYDLGATSGARAERQEHEACAADWSCPAASARSAVGDTPRHRCAYGSMTAPFSRHALTRFMLLRLFRPEPELGEVGLVFAFDRGDLGRHVRPSSAASFTRKPTCYRRRTSFHGCACSHLASLGLELATCFKG